MKPILFSTEMVQDIFECRKTVTRRVINPQPVAGLVFPKAKYKVGDILWVRETWARVSDWADVDPVLGLDDGYMYKANWPTTGEHPRWHPSIFMPKEAARLFLKVTGVRVERLQDITVDNVYKEGFRYLFEASIPFQRLVGTSFESTWNRLNAKRGYDWNSDPWVWVIEFERLEKDMRSEVMG